MYNGIVPIASTAPSATTNAADMFRKNRTRAKRSCDLCRKKKTRCDSDVNQPCTKCRLVKSKCQFLAEQKKRGRSQGNYVEVLENRLLRMEKLLHNIAKEKNQDTTDKEDANSPGIDRDYALKNPRHLDSVGQTQDKHAEAIIPNYLDDDDDDDEAPNLTCPIKQPTLGSDNECDTIEEQMQHLTISDYQRTRYLGASSGVHFLNQELFSTNKKHRLPEAPSWFVQKLNKDEEEHVFIKTKEVLPATLNIGQDNTINRIALFEDTPHMTQEFVDYLVHMYFTRIHNYCPIINKVQFIEQYYYHSPSPPDRYLLYAIAFIGISIFKIDITNAKVFNLSTEQLDDIEVSMKNKAHKLMSIVYKRSMISTVQALMLLSMFMGHGENDKEDTSHWFITGMAIRMAQDLGLHRDCSKWLIPDYEIELRKRIWYGAYLMDRWVAAELGRPISIIDNEFDVELPSSYELNYTLSPVHSEKTNSTPILILEAEEALHTNKPVYSSFVYLVTLSQIAGQVLVGLHSTRAKQNRHNSLELVNILDRSLNNWKASLPPELRVDLSNPTHYFSTPAGVVNMAHACILLLLYRPFIRNHAETENTDLAFKALSICTATATNLLAVVEAMERDYFVALPWNMSVYSIFQATIVFLHNAKGKNELVKEQGRQHLLRCSKVYLGDPYLKVTRIVKVLQSLVENFHVQMDDGRTCTNSPILGIRKKRSDNVPHNSFVTETVAESDRHIICEAETPKEKHSSTFTVTTGHILASQSSVKSSSSNSSNSSNSSSNSSCRETAPTIPNSFAAAPYLSGSRPEDMFYSSLYMGLGSSMFKQQQLIDVSPDMSQRQQQQQQQLTDQSMSMDFEKSEFFESDTVDPSPKLGEGQCSFTFDSSQHQQYSSSNHQQAQHNANTFLGIYNMEPISQLQPTQFDLASLSSQVPLWDVPSGITWNEWESFLKANVDNTSASEIIR